MPRIYCSGPLFCAEEVGGMTAISNVLEQAGHSTFLPHRDGLEPYVLRFGDNALQGLVPGLRHGVDYAIFALDAWELLARCDAVVCNLNGRVPDEGMIVEASLAFACGIPVVFYKSDARAPFGGQDNAMLTALAGPAEAVLERLPVRVAEALAQAGPRGAPAPALAKAVADGGRLGAVLARLPKRLGKQQWSPAMVAEVLREAGLA